MFRKKSARVAPTRGLSTPIENNEETIKNCHRKFGDFLAVSSDCSTLKRLSKSLCCLSNEYFSLLQNESTKNETRVGPKIRSISVDHQLEHSETRTFEKNNIQKPLSASSSRFRNRYLSPQLADRSSPKNEENATESSRNWLIDDSIPICYLNGER